MTTLSAAQAKIEAVRPRQSRQQGVIRASEAEFDLYDQIQEQAALEQLRERRFGAGAWLDEDAAWS